MKKLLAILIPVILIAGCTTTANCTGNIIANGCVVTHVRGPDNAAVTITEFSDFQCPACGAAESVVEQVLAAYPTQVKLIYKDFPLSIHPYAQKASEAAECAGERGKYWEMHDILFANQNALRTYDLKNYATNLGLNTTKFDACLDSGKASADIKADLNEGNKLGVNGTPTFFINDEKFLGAPPFETWKTVIDQMLE